MTATVSSRALVLAASTLIFSLASATPARAEGQGATAIFKTVSGSDAGTATLVETSAGVLLTLDLKGLPPGPHALHIYEKGTCDADFSSAGAIHNPLGAQHGLMNDEGPMAGDLPNIYAASDGTLKAEIVSALVSLNKETEDGIFDADGSALIVLEKPDDHLTEPDGGAGARLACGAITAK